MTNEHSHDQAGYYTDSDIARLLGISLGRLRNKLTAGNPLPPRIEPPGCRRRLWPCKAVHAWLAQYTVTATVPPVRHPAYRSQGQAAAREAHGRRR